MDRLQIEIKNVEDRLTVAKILISNGYTARIVAVKKPNRSQKTTVIEYWKEEGNE